MRDLVGNSEVLPTPVTSSLGGDPTNSIPDAIAAVQITSRLAAVHGAPVHIGFPEAIGIPDLYKPDFGDADLSVDAVVDRGH